LKTKSHIETAENIQIQTGKEEKEKKKTLEMHPGLGLVNRNCSYSESDFVPPQG
jgi:hypothetical protein